MQHLAVLLAPQGQLDKPACSRQLAVEVRHSLHQRQAVVIQAHHVRTAGDPYLRLEVLADDAVAHVDVEQLRVQRAPVQVVPHRRDVLLLFKAHKFSPGGAKLGSPASLLNAALYPPAASPPTRKTFNISPQGRVTPRRDRGGSTLTRGAGGGYALAWPASGQ